MLSLSLFLVGLGILFTGINTLTNILKYIGSQPFRKLATKFMSPRWKAVLFGVVSGVFLQSTSAALIILASINCTGGITVSQAMAILTGFSVGNCVLPFLVSIDIKAATFFVVGISAIALYFVKSDRLRNACTLLFGLGLIFFGIEMMLEGVRPLRQEAWFTGVMELSRNYSLLSIMAGMALGFIVQSSTAVALVAIGLARGNVLTGPQAFLLMYGAAIGSTLFKVVIGQAFHGTSRQLIRFVNMFNMSGAAFFILLYYIEVYLHVPLIMALLNSFKLDLAHQAAWVFLLFNLTSAIFFIAINGPLTRWLARSLPASEEESLSRPKYLSEFQPQDPDTSMELIRLEQTRELEQIAAFVSTVRENYDGAGIASRHEAFRSLAREVAAATAAVALMPMNSRTAQYHAYCQTRQALLDQLADSTASGMKIIMQTRAYPSLETLSDACMESIDFLLILAAETEKTNDPEEVRMLLDLSSRNGTTMEQLRKAYIDGDKLSSANEKGGLLDLTIMIEKIIWLLNRLVSLMPAENITTK